MALTGHFYRVGASPPGYMPWHDDCAFGNFTNCTMPGIDGELLLSLAQLLNFTYIVEILLPPENLTIPNPTWDDFLTYYLINNLIDFTMNSISMTTGLQEKGVRFAAPLIYTDRGFMIRQPVRDLRFLLTQPFEREVWCCLFGSAIALASLCAIVWRPTEQDDNLTGKREGLMGWIRHLGRSGWTIGLITLQQSLPPSYYLHRRPYTQKMLIAFWIVGSFVLTASYSAMLISVLLDVGSRQAQFKNVHQLADLIENHGYRTIIAADEKDMFDRWISILERRPLFKAYVKALRDHPPIVAPSFEVVVDKILEDRYLVYPCRLTEVRYRIKEIRCNVTFIPSWEERLPTSPGFSRSFQNLEAFSRAYLTLGTAVLNEIKGRYLPEPICDPTPSDMSLGTHQLQGGFWIMGGGALSAFLVFATEGFLIRVRSLCRKRPNERGMQPRENKQEEKHNELENGTNGKKTN